MTALPSPWPDVTPATTTEPLSCDVRSPEARSATTNGGAAGPSQFPRSRPEPRTDGRRPPSSSLDAAAPSGCAVVPGVVGIDHRRLPAFLGRFPTQGQTPPGVSSAFTRFAVEKPRFRRICLTISVLSLGPASGCATTLIQPGCLPRRAVPSGLLNPEARGIGLLPYDWQ